MKPCLFLLIMTGSLYKVSGQTQPGKILTRIQTDAIRRTTEKPVEKPDTLRLKTIGKKVQMQPAPAPLSKQEPPTPEKPVAYYLNTAKVIIRTGNDSKEQLSRVTLQISRKGGPYSIKDSDIRTGLFNDLPNKGNTYEFKANTPVELNLQNVYSPEYRWNETLLSLIEQHGLKLTIVYDPNFFTDAWKINRVTLVLNFKDISGNPHPVLGNKEVHFIDAAKLLTNNSRKLICGMDGFLMSKPVK